LDVNLFNLFKIKARLPLPFGRALVGTIAPAISRNIAAAPGRIHDKMAQLAHGALDVTITEGARSDEVGAADDNARLFRALHNHQRMPVDA
jgi:hypothetical protein